MTTTHGYWAIWLAVVAIGLVTFSLRFSFVFLFGRVDDVSPGVKRALRFVPPAVFAALAFPAVLALDGSLVGAFADERVPAALLAGLVAWRTENVLATILVGMSVLWTLRFLV